jgi:RecA-family ATPase
MNKVPRHRARRFTREQLLELGEIKTVFENCITVDAIKEEAMVLLNSRVNEQEEVKSIYSATELLQRETENIPNLLEPIFPKVGLCGFAGSSDTGKSSFLRQLAISVGTGESEFLGFKLNAENKRAIYVSTEDDDSAISNLLKKANKKKQLPPENYSGLTFIFDSYELLQNLNAELSKKKADLIIIDAFADIYSKSSMNDTGQVRNFLNDYSQLAQKHKCLVIFLHHTGKRTEDMLPSKNNLLGSQGFEAKMRLVIELRTDHSEPQKRHLCIVKGNYLPKEYKTESYVLKFDELLQFTKTGERRPFEELVPNKNSETKERVIALKNEGKTQQEIADKLKISQTTVCRYLKK